MVSKAKAKGEGRTRIFLGPFDYHDMSGYGWFLIRGKDRRIGIWPEALRLRFHLEGIKTVWVEFRRRKLPNAIRFQWSRDFVVIGDEKYYSWQLTQEWTSAGIDFLRSAIQQHEIWYLRVLVKVKDRFQSVPQLNASPNLV
jgi:hypothetical protein